jgi:hypothetical protein
VTTRPEPVADVAFAWLVGLLALPWLLHAQLVLASSLGFTPLASRIASWAMIVAAVAGAMLLGHFARSRGARMPQPPSAAEGAAPRVLRALPIAGGVAVLYPLVTAALLPIIAYDAVAYRLPTIAQWLDAGRIAWVASDDPVRNGYPLGQEAVAAVIAAASGSLRFASTTSYFYVLPAAVAIHWLARCCGVRTAFARAAAATFLLVPMLILNAPSGYVDASFASACVCLFCSAALCEGGASRWLWLCAGMAAAHVLALKGTGLPFLVLIAGSCGARALVRRRAPSLAALRGGGRATAPGLFWPLRNLVHTGNPLWPIRVDLGGKTLLPGVGTAEQILDVASNTPPALASHAAPVRVLLTWLQWRGPAMDFDYRLSGLGYAWLYLAVPAQLALLYRLWREPELRARHAPIAFVLLLTAACFALQPMAWWPRYTLWLWGAGALAIGCQLELSLRERSLRVQTVLALALTLLAIGEAGWALVHVHGMHLALRRYEQPSQARRGASFWQSLDLQHALQAKRWIDPSFWQLGLQHDARVCRAEWKPKTDNTNLDGVFAQLSPRPRMFIVPDDHVTWTDTKRAWQRAGCPALLIFRGSPVLATARSDAGVNVRAIRAFDPLYLLRPRAR